jgi:hypothetical protein
VLKAMPRGPIKNSDFHIDRTCAMQLSAPNFSTMKVATRLALAFGVVLLLSVITSGLSLVSISGIQAHMDEVVLDEDATLGSVHAMTVAMHLSGESLRDVVLQQDPALRDKAMATLKQQRKLYDDASAALEKQATSDSDRAAQAKSHRPATRRAAPLSMC